MAIDSRKKRDADGVIVDPTAARLERDGALRPQVGPGSATWAPHGRRAPGGPFDLDALDAKKQRAAAGAPQASAPFAGYPIPANGGRAPGGPFDSRALDERAAAISAGPPAPSKVRQGAGQPSRLMRGSMPVMGALAADMNTARGMSLHRPIREGVQSGVAGPAVDRYHTLAREAATAGMNLPGAMSPGSAVPSAPRAANAPAARDPSIPTIATVTPQAFQAGPMPGARSGGAIMRAGFDGVPPSPAAGVQSGVQTSAPTPATSISGRPLGYGKTIDGVRVFSDGSGTGAIPRTMSDAQISGLARQINVADPGVTGLVPATGGLQRPAQPGAVNDRLAVQNLMARTPTQEQAVSERMALSRPQGPVFHMPDAGTMAMHDAAAFARRDTRSAAGRAGDALYRAAQPSGFTTRASRKAAGEAFAAGPGGIASGGIKQAGDQAVVGMQEQGANQRLAQQGWQGMQQEALRGANELQRAIVSRPQQAPTQINMEGNTLGLLGPDGVVRAARGEDGQPVRTQLGRPTALDQGAYSKAVSENINRLLGIDPLTGKMANGQAPTPEDWAAAQSAAMAMANEVFGQQPGAGQAAQRPSREQFMTAARQANPGASDAELDAYYRRNYGN